MKLAARPPLALVLVLALAAGCGSFGDAGGGAQADAATDGGATNDAALDGSAQPDASAPSAYATEVILDAPLAWYPLDDPMGSTTVRNAVDGARPATLVGGVMLGKPSLVRGAGSAASFDGTSSVLELGTGLEFAAKAPYSLEAWVSPSRIDPEYRRLFSCESGVSGSAWAGYNLSIQLDQLTFSRVSGAAVCNASAMPAPIMIATTHHVVATFDGATTRLYVDAKPLAENSCAASNPHTSGTLNVGAIDPGTSAFVGVMDEIAIYDKALTPLRIRAHYDAGKP
ncbi:MAG: Autotransporter adhesin [Labilithrix sp.]|nr:Autotransporter adhesin [Labilithrix sp.]